MRQLVESWLEAEREQNDLNQHRAIRRLNEALGLRISHSRVSEWRRGKYCPSNVVLSEMLYRTLPWLLKKAGLEPSTAQQDSIDKLLWVFERSGKKDVRYSL